MKKKSSKHKLIRQSLSTAILYNWNRDRCLSEKTCVISGLVFSPIKYQTMPCKWQTAYGWFPPSPNFYLRTCVNFTHVNKIEAMYESLCVNVKVERGFSFLRSRTTFHTLPLYHLHTQNYTTLEIHPYTNIVSIKANDTRKGSLFIIIYKDRIQEPKNQVNHLTRCAT